MHARNADRDCIASRIAISQLNSWLLPFQPGTQEISMSWSRTLVLFLDSLYLFLGFSVLYWLVRVPNAALAN